MRNKLKTLNGRQPLKGHHSSNSFSLERFDSHLLQPFPVLLQGLLLDLVLLQPELVQPGRRLLLLLGDILQAELPHNNPGDQLKVWSRKRRVLEKTLCELFVRKEERKVFEERRLWRAQRWGQGGRPSCWRPPSRNLSSLKPNQRRFRNLCCI